MATASTSPPYDNYWGVAYVTYPLCLSSSVTENFYSFLTGVNLNSGIVFETWYTLTNGYATTAWLTVYTSTNTYTYSAAIPSGNPDIAINGWEQNIVCGNGGGCYTSFSSGGGSINYFQDSIQVSNPNTSYYTAENSNCNYSTVTINVNGNSGSQTYSC